MMTVNDAVQPPLEEPRGNFSKGKPNSVTTSDR